MANTKSAQKRAKQSEKKRLRNLARKSAVKSAVKKVLTTLEDGHEAERLAALLQEAEAQIARARSKGIFHRNTAARKIGRLAKRVARARRAASQKSAKK